MQSLRQYRQLQSQSDNSLKAAKSQNGLSVIPRSPPNGLASSEGNSSFSSRDDFILVDWSPNEPQNPRNWSFPYKVFVSFLVFLNVFVLDWCSSATSQASSKVAAEFHISAEAETLASAMYVFGIAAGALFAGPISETVGRNPIYVGSRVLHLGFILGTALARNYGTQVVCRFLAGLGASTILSIHGASVADLFGPEGRSYVWPFVGSASFFGTSLSPVVGGWIAQSSHISWRWTDWIPFIMSGFTFLISILFLPETFAPILLKWKAHHLRKSAKNQLYLAEIELQREFHKRLGANLKRAYIIATREYICLLFMAWLVVLYIVVFGFLQGFNYLFYDTYNFSRGQTGTSFATLAVGIVLYLALTPFIAYKHEKEARRWKQKTDGKEELPPEYRMLPAFAGAITFPIAMFWLGWTNYASLSPWSCFGAAALFGFSWTVIYLQIYQYILDVYGVYAGTALATITCTRYIFSGTMQLASRPLWMALGTHWTCTLLGCLALLLAPVPWVIWRFGERIRRVSRYAGHKMNKDGAENPSQEFKI